MLKQRSPLLILCKVLCSRSPLFIVFRVCQLSKKMWLQFTEGPQSGSNWTIASKLRRHDPLKEQRRSPLLILCKVANSAHKSRAEYPECRATGFCIPWHLRRASQAKVCPAIWDTAEPGCLVRLLLLLLLYCYCYCYYYYYYYYITTLLHYYITTLLHYYITTLLHYYITTLLHYYITTLLHYYITTLLHYYSTTVLQYYSTTLLHYYITTLLHYYITTTTTTTTTSNSSYARQKETNTNTSTDTGTNGHANAIPKAKGHANETVVIPVIADSHNATERQCRDLTVFRYTIPV